MIPVLSEKKNLNSINLREFIENIRPSLQPPVSNRLLFGAGQLKVMIVGGPNNRKVISLIYDSTT